MILILLINHLFALQGGTFTDDPRIQESVVQFIIVKTEHKDGISRSHTSSCSGTVIGERQILTAAHCKLEDSTAIIMKRQISAKPLEYDVILSTVTAFTDHPTVAEQKCKFAYACHSEKIEAYDLAVITLADAIELPAIPLHKGNLISGDTEITLAGFGSNCKNKKGNPDKRLTSYKIPLKNFSSDLMEISKKPQSTCEGDSGGPVFVEVNGKLQIVGVISHNTTKWLVSSKDYASRIHFNGSDSPGVWIENLLNTSDNGGALPTNTTATASK